MRSHDGERKVIHLRILTYQLEKFQIGDVIPLGFAGENEHTRIVFEAGKMLEEYPRAVPAMTVKPPKGDPYPTVVTKVDQTVVWDVTDVDLAKEGGGKLQLSFVQDGVIAKTWTVGTRIHGSLQPTGEVPEPIDDWLTRAEAVLAEIPESIDEELAEAKAEIAGMRDDAQAAQRGAEAAQGYAEAAQTAAENARGLAVAAKERAVLAEDNADGAAVRAYAAKDDAVAARNLAVQWATGGSSGTPSATNNALYYAGQAANSATSAEQSADRAEQSAATAGFMEMQMDEYGHLIYIRTDQVDVDFEMDENGHLVMKSA